MKQSIEKTGKTGIAGKVGKVERFQETFALTRRIQGSFHWTHIRILSIDPSGGNAPSAAGGQAHATVGEALLAVVASKKLVDRRAVGRNRAKRRIRPIMIKLTQEWLGSLQRSAGASESNGAAECNGTDLRLHWIVRPKNSAITATAKELENDVRRAFEDYIQSWKGSRATSVPKKDAPSYLPRGETRIRSTTRVLCEASPH